MRELDLFADYLLRLRREKLELAHATALQDQGTLERIRIYAEQAELCQRMHAALKVLANDSGKFIEAYLP